jgi:glycosidase
LLGTEKDFRDLCEKGKALGIRFILDGVFSHTGADSLYFNKYGRYGKGGAFNDPKSPYKDWYFFKKYPQDYESWWGFNSLPNVNENNPDYTKYITGVSADGKVDSTTADTSILKKWLDAGASGWRLDVADELPDEFIDNVRKGIKHTDTDAILYGEVWEDASTKESYGVKRRYLLGEQLDGVMNYPFAEVVHNYVRYGSYREFVDGVMTICENYPKPTVDVLMNFLGTHDTERAITRLATERAGNHNREWQSTHELSDAEYAYGAQLLRVAYALMFFLPGVPCVYYGDEAGLEGFKDPFNRGTYPWGQEDFTLIEFIKTLSAVRKTSSAFVDGDIRFWAATEDRLVFTRVSGDNGALICINRTKQAAKFLYRDLPLKVVSAEVVSGVEAIGATTVPVLRVPPFGYAVVKLKLKNGTR